MESGVHFVNINTVPIITWANLEYPQVCLFTNSSLRSFSWPSSVASLLYSTEILKKEVCDWSPPWTCSQVNWISLNSLLCQAVPPSTASFPVLLSPLLEDCAEWTNRLESHCQDLGLACHLESQICSSSDWLQYLSWQALCTHDQFWFSKYPYKVIINYSHFIDGDPESWYSLIFLPKHRSWWCWKECLFIMV